TRIHSVLKPPARNRRRLFSCLSEAPPPGSGLPGRTQSLFFHGNQTPLIDVFLFSNRGRSSTGEHSPCKRGVRVQLPPIPPSRTEVPGAPRIANPCRQVRLLLGTPHAHVAQPAEAAG